MGEIPFAECSQILVIEFWFEKWYFLFQYFSGIKMNFQILVIYAIIIGSINAYIHVQIIFLIHPIYWIMSLLSKPLAPCTSGDFHSAEVEIILSVVVVQRSLHLFPFMEPVRTQWRHMPPLVKKSVN